MARFSGLFPIQPAVLREDAPQGVDIASPKFQRSTGQTLLKLPDRTQKAPSNAVARSRKQVHTQSRTLFERCAATRFLLDGLIEKGLPDFFRPGCQDFVEHARVQSPGSNCRVAAPINCEAASGSDTSATSAPTT